jgi:DNA (cytosine-5)-methyltransferase 1
LSARACEGILNRAKRRGKELPEELRKALEEQSVSRNVPESLGGGKGILIQEEHVGALSTLNNQAVCSLRLDNGSASPVVSGDISPTIRQGAGPNGCANAAVFCLQGNMVDREVQQGGTGIRENIAYTLDAVDRHAVYSMQGFGDYKQSDVASSCKMRDYKDSTDLIAAVDFRNGTENPETNGTLQAKESGGQSINYQNTCRIGSVVRRLTPMECERLQGYPDGWTDIGDWTDSKGKKRKAADGPRYKALGNSIALPFWQFLARRICAQYERDITLGSLFDGIGGFPYVFERCGAKAVWASEIEEFAIAVTKNRFSETGE